MTTKTFKGLFDNYETYLTNKSIAIGSDTIADFKDFLTDNGYSDNHADSLYNYYKNGVVPKLSDFKLRKMHPKRDAFIKKFLVPVTATAGVVATGVSTFASALLPAGSQFLWMQTVSNPLLNFLNIGITTSLITGVGCAAFILGKNFLTRLYYSLRYGNDKKVLKELEDGTAIENTKLAKLTNKIESTKEKILDLREGNWYTAPFRFVGKHILNIWNRNRIHHVEAVTKNLLERYMVKLSDPNSTNLEKHNDAEMQRIVSLLQSIQQFAKSDIESSKLYALLSCKENNKNHSHIIENADIFASMAICEDIALSGSTDKKAASRRSHNLSEKTATAERLINNDSDDNLLRKAVARYHALAPVTPPPTPATITGWEKFFTGTKFKLDNGKFLIVNSLDDSIIASATYDASAKEVRIGFTSSAPDTIYSSGNELSNRQVTAIYDRRTELLAIYNYILAKRDELKANIPTTDIKLNNLLVAIQNSFNTSADFTLTGAARTLFNKVRNEYLADAAYGI